MGVEFVNLGKKKRFEVQGVNGPTIACHTDATFWKFNITLPPLFTLFGRSKAWIMVQTHVRDNTSEC